MRASHTCRRTQVADLVGVVVDAVEHLADGLLGQLGERLTQRRLEQVRAQPALGAVRAADPGVLPGGVEHGRTDEADASNQTRPRVAFSASWPATTVPSRRSPIVPHRPKIQWQPWQSLRA